MGAAPFDPTPEQLLEALADAGELDAGVELFDAIRMRDPSAATLLALQARLFDAPDDAPITRRREVLAPWRDDAFERLAQRGALLEVAVGLRVMARVFSDEPTWAERAARLESVLTPMPESQHDPARAAIDEALMRGAVTDAWERLRALARQEPDDAELARRTEVLQELLFPPSGTRPYDAQALARSVAMMSGAPSMVELAASVQAAVRGGDLTRALTDATALAEHPNANPRWIRFRDAMQRILTGATPTPPSTDDEEVTTRTGPLEMVAVWLRAGNLTAARDALRAQLAHTTPEAATHLAPRLADLDVVLDGTLPTPVPARPPPAAVSGVSVSSSRSQPPGTSTLEAPPAIPRQSTTPAMLTAPAEGTEDTEPARPQLAAVPPTEAPAQKTISQPPPTGDVKVSKRKIVRLS